MSVLDILKKAAEFLFEKGIPGVASALLPGPLAKLVSGLAASDWGKSLEVEAADATAEKLDALVEKCVAWLKAEVAKEEAAHPVVKEFIDEMKAAAPVKLPQKQFDNDVWDAILKYDADGSLRRRLGL